MTDQTALTLSRHARESIMVGQDVEVQVLSVSTGQDGRPEVRLRVVAPRSVRILRVGADGQIQCKNIRPAA